MITLEILIAAVSGLLVGAIAGGIAGLRSSDRLEAENALLRAELRSRLKVIERISDRHRERTQ